MKKDFLHSFATAIFFCLFAMTAFLVNDLQAQAAYPVIDTSRMHAYYDFLGSFRDSTGINADAVPHKAELTSDRFCNPQNAVLLTDTGSYLRVEDHPSLDFSDTLSISFWIYLDSVPDMETRIISKSDPAKPDSGSYWISIYPDNQEPSGSPWSFSYTDANGNIQTFRCEWGMITGNWINYTVTYAGNNVTLWLGLEPCAEFETGGSAILPNNDPLWFGNGVGSGITGKMDDILLYNRMVSVEEIENLSARSLFTSDINPVYLEPVIGDSVELFSTATGANIQYQFLKGEEVIQDGVDSTCMVVIESEEDFATYFCRAYTCTEESTKRFTLKSCVLYEGIYFYEVLTPTIYASEGDPVNIWFYVNDNLDGLVYEMYHNDVLMPDVFRGIVRIEQATLADSGEYYFVVHNGCERLVSDTVTLIMEGQGYTNYKVEGWDWTGNISGAGSSYFSSITMGKDSSIYLLGHFAGGLKVEDVEVFSSVKEDIFIVKYDKDGVYQWSKFLVSPFFKRKGDLAVDSEGNLYVTGSFWESIEIEDHTLTTDQVAGSGYMVKYDPMGELLWIKEMNTTRGVNCDNIEIDSADRIYLGGNFKSTLSIDTIEVSGDWHEYDNVMFVARMDTAGSCRWISHAVTDDMDFGLIDMDLSKSGEVVTSGTITGESDFGNGVVLDAFIQAPFLVKYNEEGEALWGTSISNEFGHAETFDVSVDDQDRIFMTGEHLGEISFSAFSAGENAPVMEEIFLARFDSEGVCTALNSYGSLGEGGDFGICYEPATDSTGYLLGLYGDTLIMKLDTLVALSVSGGGLPVSPNMFIAKLKDDGEPLALKSAGVIGRQFFGELLVREDGRLYFAGMNEGVPVKKTTASESTSVAFVAYLDAGIQERVGPVELLFEREETICLGDSVQFRSHWYKETGSYLDTASNPIGIDSIFSLQLSTEICLSLDNEPASGEYQIYPNPANQILYVNSPDREPFELMMYGISGKLIWQNREQNEYQIEVEGYEAGLYILKLIKQGESKVHKILIE